MRDNYYCPECKVWENDELARRLLKDELVEEECNALWHDMQSGVDLRCTEMTLPGCPYCHGTGRITRQASLSEFVEAWEWFRTHRDYLTVDNDIRGQTHIFQDTDTTISTGQTFVDAVLKLKRGEKNV